LLAVIGEVRDAAVVFGWQRALIEATGAIEDEPELRVIDRTRAIIFHALPQDVADAAMAQGAARDDDTIVQLSRSAMERLERSFTA
jgi:hypothetical protein